MSVGEKQKKQRLSCNGLNRADIHEKVAYLIKITFFAIELKQIWGQLGMFRHWIEPTNRICQQLLIFYSYY
jgi:hypothetical protein